MSPEKDPNDTCDGKDENCDGKVDNGFGVGEPCTTKGACGKVEGHKECLGTNATICDTAPGGSKDASVSEICNGEDDDCDGEVDNAVFSVVGGEEGATAKVGTACKGVGECKDGTYKCEDTLAVKCSAFDKAAPTDACDSAGKDDDGLGDVCDNAPNNYNPSQVDDNKDGIGNIADNAPDCFNPDALDAPCDRKDRDCYGDGIPDACDNCPEAKN